MTRFVLAASTALATALATVLASGARADVTPDEVWANMRAYLDTFGGTVTVETSHSGSTLRVGDIALEWALPFDMGTLAMRQSGFDLTDQGDGTVRFVFPEKVDFAIHVAPSGKPPVSMSMIIGHEGLATTAHGTADDVTYDTVADRMTLTLGELTLPEAAGIPEFSTEMTVTGLEGTGRVVVGNLISVSGRSEVAGQTAVMKMADAAGNVMDYSMNAANAVTSYSAELPRNGMSVMNLASALRDGLAVQASSEVADYHTYQTVSSGGKLVSDQNTTVGHYKVGVTLDRKGVDVSGSGDDIALRLNMPQAFPLEMNFAIAASSGQIALPVSAGEELQEATVTMAAEGVKVDEALWGLLDPAESIPRDPAVVRLDMTAQVKSYLDWFDFMKVAGMAKTGQVPGELHAVTLRDLTVEAAGASVAGSGAARFDNTDLVTFGGFPKPSGTLDLTVKGANALIDRLVGIGLLKDQDAMGARMGMGMIAKPAPELGEDALKSHLEMTDEGQVLANGIRLR